MDWSVGPGSTGFLLSKWQIRCPLASYELKKVFVSSVRSFLWTRVFGIDAEMIKWVNLNKHYLHNIELWSLGRPRQTICEDESFSDPDSALMCSIRCLDCFTLISKQIYWWETSISRAVVYLCIYMYTHSLYTSILVMKLFPISCHIRLWMASYRYVLSWLNYQLQLIVLIRSGTGATISFPRKILLQLSSNLNPP